MLSEISESHCRHGVTARSFLSNLSICGDPEVASTVQHPPLQPRKGVFSSSSSLLGPCGDMCGIQRQPYQSVRTNATGMCTIRCCWWRWIFLLDQRSAQQHCPKVQSTSSSSREGSERLLCYCAVVPVQPTQQAMYHIPVVALLYWHVAQQQ